MTQGHFETRSLFFVFSLTRLLYTYPTGGYSASFQAVKNLMASPICEARIHFGKTALFSGQGGEWNTADAEYAKATVGYEAWERFNTVVKILDPMGKFSDHNNILIEKPLLK